MAATVVTTVIQDMTDTRLMAVAVVVAMGMIPTGRNEARNLMLNVKVLTWSLGLFASLSFVLCVVYGTLVPESLHMPSALEAVFPGFRWLTFSGFLVGLVESFLYGVYSGLAFGWIYNALWKRWGSAR